jgi:hypothetical protein
METLYERVVSMDKINYPNQQYDLHFSDAEMPLDIRKHVPMIHEPRKPRILDAPAEPALATAEQDSTLLA